MTDSVPSREGFMYGLASALTWGHDDEPAASPTTMTSGDDDFESMEDFKQRLIYVLGQMMFVSGETAEPSPETTWMIEEIVREQVVEMVSCLITRSRSAYPNFPTAYTSNDSGKPPWLQVNLNCRPHLPNPPRQSQSFSPQDLPFMERRAQKCQGLR